MPPRPWTRDEYAMLDDLLRDHYPLRTIARRLGRTVPSVAAVVRKLGVRVRRPLTVPFQNQIDARAYAKLVEIAEQRCCTPATMARIITELVIANPAFLDESASIAFKSFRDLLAGFFRPARGGQPKQL